MTGQGLPERISEKRIAIVLDNAVYSAPVVNGKIPNGSSEIEGMANIDEANLLAIVLRAGALPAPVDIVEERTVGPSLGEDSIKNGVTSGIIGLPLIVLFMAFYYRAGGIAADSALLLNILFILGVLAAFHATLTLPGIGGMILTIAVAVDANVLIYERIREEIATGKTLRAAIDQGYSKAVHGIFDSNIISLLHRCNTVPVWNRAGPRVRAHADDRYRRKSFQCDYNYSRHLRRNDRTRRNNI